jgi:hypothetical protein
MLKDIKEIREGIKAGLFTNEASVSQGIVLRLLHALLKKYMSICKAPHHRLAYKKPAFKSPFIKGDLGGLWFETRHLKSPLPPFIKRGKEFASFWITSLTKREI